MAVSCALLSASTPGQDVSLEGVWDVRWQTASFIHNAPVEVFGFLVVDDTATATRATFRGRPVSILVSGRRVEFSYDEALRSEGGGRRGRVTLTFTGQLGDDGLHGTVLRTDAVIHEDALGQVSRLATPAADAAPGFLAVTLEMNRFVPVRLSLDESWTAKRRKDGETQPDLSGIWIPRPELANDWLRDVESIMTETASSRQRNWHPYDDPALRCGSSGLVRVTGNPLPVVIVQTAREVALLFESEHSIQHAFLDRPMPDAWVPSGMGYSVGRWVGPSLEIRSQWLLGNWIGPRGFEHRGVDTDVIERYTMTADGKYLLAELTLHDPLSYKEPLYRQRGYERDDSAEIYPYECDSYTFFRGLHDDGRIDEYFARPPKY